MSSRHCSSTSAKTRFKNRFGQFHIVRQFVECHLRFDHPEFRQVPGSVRVLGTKRRAERVDLAERGGEDLRFQLAADRQVSGAIEEILCKVDLAGLSAADCPGPTS